MLWEKLGLAYVPDGSLSWARSHAFVPTPIACEDGSLRVFVAFLDGESVGRVGYVDVDPQDPLRVLRYSRFPSLDVGEPGTFDEWGVTPMSVCRMGRVLRLYFTGWQRTRGERYTMLTGVAESTDEGKSFHRLRATPVLERSNEELFVRTAAHVQRTGNGWEAWYVGGSGWIEDGGKPRPTYEIRHLSSPDGLEWAPVGHVCLRPQLPHEFGFGRPFVWRESDGTYSMLYSIRLRLIGYRLGYARSVDGLSWKRHDHWAGLDVSPGGWDSEMVCFGAIVDTPTDRWLFYNGNGYGATGFGVARLVNED